MKITVEKKELGQKKERKYPYLAISITGSGLVWFIRKNEGFAISSDMWPLRYFLGVTKWYEENFTPFNGTLTISEND